MFISHKVSGQQQQQLKVFSVCASQYEDISVKCVNTIILLAPELFFF